MQKSLLIYTVSNDKWIIGLSPTYLLQSDFYCYVRVLEYFSHGLTIQFLLFLHGAPVVRPPGKSRLCNVMVLVNRQNCTHALRYFVLSMYLIACNGQLCDCIIISVLCMEKIKVLISFNLSYHTANYFRCFSCNCLNELSCYVIIILCCYFFV